MIILDNLIPYLHGDFVGRTIIQNQEVYHDTITSKDDQRHEASEFFTENRICLRVGSGWIGTIFQLFPRYTQQWKCSSLSAASYRRPEAFMEFLQYYNLRIALFLWCDSLQTINEPRFSAAKEKTFLPEIKTVTQSCHSVSWEYSANIGECIVLHAGYFMQKTPESLCP